MSTPTEVYIVTSGIYSDYGIRRVFLDRAEADDYAKAMTDTDHWSRGDYRVEKWPIGVPEPTYEDSDFAYEWTPDSDFKENYDRHRIPEGAVTHVVERSSQRVIVAGVSEDQDHVKPVSAGGPHMLSNLRPACRSCNATKNARWPYAHNIRR